MRILQGTVGTRYGVAAANLAPVEGLIRERMGLPTLTSGTLNVILPEPYIVKADAKIDAAEYNGQEFLKLQRCRVGGIRCCIMRPNTHEAAGNDGARVIEIMSAYHLRTYLNLNDGDLLNVEVEGDEAWWTSSD
jgi:CTP-dependent riboflavin kinase